MIVVVVVVVVVFHRLRQRVRVRVRVVAAGSAAAGDGQRQRGWPAARVVWTFDINASCAVCRVSCVVRRVPYTSTGEQSVVTSTAHHDAMMLKLGGSIVSHHVKSRRQANAFHGSRRAPTWAYFTLSSGQERARLEMAWTRWKPQSRRRKMPRRRPSPSVRPGARASEPV